MKAGKEHIVALSSPALAILAGIERKGDLVFPIGRDDMRALMPSGSTVHGQRSAFSSWAGEHGIDRDATENCLAHLVGNKVSRAYRRGGEIEQKRKVMERWATYLSQGEDHNIVTLDARRTA